MVVDGVIWFAVCTDCSRVHGKLLLQIKRSELFGSELLWRAESCPVPSATGGRKPSRTLHLIILGWFISVGIDVCCTVWCHLSVSWDSGWYLDTWSILHLQLKGCCWHNPMIDITACDAADSFSQKARGGSFLAQQLPLTVKCTTRALA